MGYFVMASSFLSASFIPVQLKMCSRRIYYFFFLFLQQTASKLFLRSALLCFYIQTARIYVLFSFPFSDTTSAFCRIPFNFQQPRRSCCFMMLAFCFSSQVFFDRLYAFALSLQYRILKQSTCHLKTFYLFGCHSEHFFKQISSLLTPPSLESSTTAAIANVSLFQSV